MRNFRTAAIAAATAAAVAFGGTAVATAAPAQDTLSSKVKAFQKDNPNASLSSAFGFATDAHDGLGAKNPDGSDNTDGKAYATGNDTFGQEIKDDQNGQWVKLWREGTYGMIGTAIVGAIIAAANFALYNGILPQSILPDFLRK